MRGWIGLGVLVAWIGWAAVAAADRALDKPAFTATPAELLASAQAVVAGDWPVIVLREDRDTGFDDRGRATLRRRWVYVVHAQAALDEWGTVRAQWRPSRQDRPVLRARVIGAGGDVAELDPALIAEEPVRSMAGVLDDRRRLKAALPRVQPGSIVEYEVVTIDREPAIGGGLDIHELDGRAPVSSAVVAFSAPASHALHRVERNLPHGVRIQHQRVGGRDRWSYELPLVPAAPARELYAPGDVAQAPYLGVATAASWAAVARDYRAVVDRRIAEGPVALPAELPRTPSLETLEAIAGWIRHQIRYTGIEFGDASVVPWPPAETIKRGFGDCKDQAALLVALLRQAGIRAELALLSSSAGPDVDPDLPAIGAFDHAIVRARLGGRDVWIDATADLQRPGQLPRGDRGRRALVISDDTTGLAITPPATASDQFREVRTFTAAEDGPSQLTVATRSTGDLEAGQRLLFRDVPAGKLERLYRELASQWFRGALERVASTTPSDLAVPFEETLAVKDAYCVFAGFRELTIELHPGTVLIRLPYVVLDKPGAPRIHDFAWPKPQVIEIENRIELPPGFSLPAVPPERRVALGPATFTERRWIDGQALVVAFRLDTGKPRITPAELAALQDAVHELGEETVRITLPRTAFALLDAGKLRDAVAEAERMIALHPREPLHHIQLAGIYLEAGAGDAARREARRAVALAPDDAGALVGLGWVLNHDRLGREFMYDWDRAGALAVLTPARRQHPDDAGLAYQLARTLERGASGALYAADADLRGAAEAWRAAVSLRHEDEDALHLSSVLLWSGDAAQAEKVARGAAASPERDAAIASAVAEARGAAEALRVAGELRTGAERQQLLMSVSRAMLQRRRYDLVRALAPELAGAAQAPPNWSKAIAPLARHPSPPSSVRDPRSAVTALLLAVADRSRKSTLFWDAELERALRIELLRHAPRAMPGHSRTEIAADALTSAEVRIDGGAGLWRARFEVAGASVRLYLALDRGAIKVIGSNALFAFTGRYALTASLGDARAVAQGKQLLDWIREDVDHATGGNAVMFRKLWDASSATPDAIRLAAATLSGWLAPDPAIPIALACRSQLADAAQACRRTLATAYATRRQWTEAAAALDAMRAVALDEVLPLTGTYGNAMVHAGRLDDAERFADEVLARHPDNGDAMFLRYRVAVERPQAQGAGAAEVARRAEAVVQQPRAGTTPLNAVAWFELGRGGDLGAALEAARRAVQAADSSYAARNTVASIEAEIGDLVKAVADNRMAMEWRGDDPGDDDWYVAARIDEQIGLTDDARAIYARLAKPTAEPFSTAAYAGRRLAALRTP